MGAGGACGLTGQEHAISEVTFSYPMLTQNCDAHPLLRLMHRPDPKLPADQPEKHAVVLIAPKDWEQRFLGCQNEARELIRLPDLALFRHGAADAVKAVELNF